MGEFRRIFLIIISYSHGNTPAHDTPELRNFSGYNIQEVSKYSKFCWKGVHRRPQNMMKGATRLPGKPKFIVFIVDENAEDLRRRIKYTCDVQLGIPNQCVVSTNMNILNQIPRLIECCCSDSIRLTVEGTIGSHRTNISKT